MQIDIPIGISIAPSKGSKSETLKGIADIESFMKNMPKIINQFGKRAEKASKHIAPVKTGGLRNSIKAEIDIFGVGLTVSPNDYLEESMEWNNSDEFDNPKKSIPVGNPVRGIMQEFGYPYDYDYWHAPYAPNPKGGKAGIKGLGYMRIAYVIAARSLHTDNIAYGLNGINRQSVIGYVRSTEKEFSASMQKLLVKYVQRKNLPRYLSTKSTPQAPFKLDLGKKISYGVIKDISLNLPLNIENNYGDSSSYRRGLNLSTATRSFYGKEEMLGGFLI
jgi:hypothetical protein